MRKLIRVKQEHIDATGDSYDMRTCPVARAIRDEIDETDVKVTQTRIWVGNMTVLHPTRVNAFVRKYDTSSERKSVEPFNFYLEVSDNA